MPRLYLLLLIDLLTGWVVLAWVPNSMPSVYLAESGGTACMSQLQKVERRWSGYIYSHQTFPAPYSTDSKNCFLLIMAEPAYRIRLSIVDFNIRHSDECKKESLALLDQDKVVKGVNDTPGPIKGQYCGTQTNGSVLFESKFNALTLWWHTGDTKSRGFRLQWTLFRDKPKEGCSVTQEVECRSGECIPNQLACDSIAHCLDSTDLKASIQQSIGCENVSSWSLLGDLNKAVVASICVGIVIGSVLICVVASVCCRDLCQTRHSSNESTDSNRLSKPYSRTPPTYGQGLLRDGYRDKLPSR